MIRVHHLNNSRSQRVLWLLEELELAYEVVRYERDAKTLLAPATLRRVHPLGKAPVIEDGALTLAETGAIIEYLVTSYGGERLAPAQGTVAWWRYVHWLHYAEGSAMPPLLLKLVLGKLGPLGWPARRFTEAQIGLHLDYMERELESASWFAGDRFSAADVMLSFPLEVAVARGGLGAGRPALRRFLDRVHARPAHRRALAHGGRYAYAE